MIQSTVNNIEHNYQEASNFQFTMDIYPDFTFYLTSVVTPGFHLGIVEMDTPLIPEKYAGTSFTIDDIVLTFIIDEKFENYKKLKKWMWKFKKNQNEKRTNMLTSTETLYSQCMLEILDNNKNVIDSMYLYNCFPVDLTGLNLTTQGEHTIQTADLTLVVQNIKWADEINE